MHSTLPNPSFRRSFWPGACLLAGLLLTGAAQAEKADRSLPLNAEADALRYDDARQTSIFTGNVVITKGTIIIRGARVEVRQDAQGHQFGIVNGSPGFFRQKRDVVDEFIEGTAQRIEYDSQADTVRFVGDAVLKRFKGTQLNDETTGSVIVYNNTTDVFTVDGGVANRTANNPTGRVRAMLTPVAKDGAPAATPAPPANLRPSNQLGEGQQ
ncbi:lipopolysaccharide transport periplasmic protein LptA [Hydrogenophaga sp.]|uniref:lipopolysaccharide transport periplasmic protein LptA n=1 Tax=Hydrogenophaga sp. TaxID=1904254 RepID=UPI002731868C|nr:lipopolysaccharide transport periplasmic protein LptA [Hydrogenophaga sp.]MDP2016921.1 lipopolysaccharide transport periplasmic protein LptA [Hydrogenophaga sp.]MDP3164045.1 lipopolysaccharide transport periplasmic protein LptA [Hydrogenophaga sp.]MDP3812489.1 lipopolysaccharide transport periplasmic protein LptA [Hydrogenophaga sp.]